MPPESESSMRPKRYSNLVGFDDAPFAREWRGNVPIVGAVFAGPRLDGVLAGKVARDGEDAGARVIELVSGSRFAEHIQLVMLQGIAFAGFNVVDVFRVREDLGMPVLVVSRVAPDMDAIRTALLDRIPQGPSKWALIERLGPMEPIGRVFVQRVGLTSEEAADILARFTLHGHIPEPIRVAHLIAGGIGWGASRGNA